MQRVARILRAYWKAIVALTLAGGLAGLGWSALQPRVYTADASGYVASVSSDGSTSSALAGGTLALSRVKSFIDMGYWKSVAETARDELGLTDSPESLVQRIRVSNPVDTVNVRVDATGPTPEAARDLAQAWLQGMTVQVDQLESTGGGHGAVKLVAGDSARLPTAPSSPNEKLAIAVGALAGAVAGVLFALVRRAFDRRVRSAHDISDSVDVSVVGILPVDKELAAGRAVFSFDDIRDGRGSFAHKEAMRELRTNLQYVDVDRPPRVMVVTSPLPGDGKSTTAANLAVSIAATGQSVILIDADLRRPVLGATFGFSDDVGLSDVLAGRARIEQVAHQVDENGRLFVVAAGRTPPNPSEMVGSQRMQQLARTLADDMVVIIDSPPTLAVADAAVIANWADGAVLVVTAGRTTDDMLQRAVGNIAKTRGRLLGVVLNRVPLRGADSNYYGSQYGGYYGYGAPSSGVDRPRWWRRPWRRATVEKKDAGEQAPGPRRRSAELPPSNVRGLRTLAPGRKGSPVPGDSGGEGVVPVAAPAADVPDDRTSRRRQRG
ncbi:polysaccharide biosynthesis tyrosine autokinase [Microbacterium sp. RURRCA19A]|uniref:polysaccharide biosynthesis tyrosine autokinase n=1 Tax=Microbacterium sp. RURRCA19A TaxID=1907391 RepID=UPI0009563067|nr:polysaccharide biosynthesis tyrosine autokinase [Microbacterium sp. RURRCA19A]SIR76800.1 capsular exopolysaccharide family [Microbacterium sp. RURRCA19A]